MSDGRDAAVYRGLMPRLIGELLTIWLVNFITHICITHLATADNQCPQVARELAVLLHTPVSLT